MVKVLKVAGNGPATNCPISIPLAKTQIKTPTRRFTIANNFEGFERCEIRELSGERHWNSRKDQPSTNR
jgi:hypothetical protein